MMIAQSTKRKKAFEQRLQAAMEQHRRALISYYLQTRQTDQFGNVDYKKWVKKIEIFLVNQVGIDARNFSYWRNTKSGVDAVNKVHAYTVLQVESEQAKNPLTRVDTQELTPVEYERYCGELLRHEGWTVTYTPLTADGGADFIAEKDDFRLIAQVKRYSKPVGNKAVQEANSAVRLYRGNAACVIAPRGFTAQAQREAQALNVELLHHSELTVYAIGLIEDT